MPIKSEVDQTIAALEKRLTQARKLQGRINQLQRNLTR